MKSETSGRGRRLITYFEIECIEASFKSNLRKEMGLKQPPSIFKDIWVVNGRIGLPVLIIVSSLSAIRLCGEKNHLKFLDDARLSPDTKDLICWLLCDVGNRDKLYEMKAAYKPQVNGDLDTQNFTKFYEELCPKQTRTRSGPLRKVEDLCFGEFGANDVNIKDMALAPASDVRLHRFFRDRRAKISKRQFDGD
ncbi:hypothetical protein PTKIN_Ptkin12aG0211900 [Pterospermum kingtungense]